MRERRENYEMLVDNFQDHISEMTHHDGRSSSYATEAEIKATSAVYDIDIFV